MLNLLTSLRESDPAVLRVIARYWKIDIRTVEANDVPAVLDAAMRQPEAAERAWDALDDAQRGALQSVLGSLGEKMPRAFFERLHGEIRKMGRGQIEREDPLANPQSMAEALYYRGLIYQAFEQAATGARPVIYVPMDLAEALPTHKTAYDDLEAAPLDALPLDTPGEVPPIEAEFVESVMRADTTVVDDLTTLLAFVRVYGLELRGDGLDPDDAAAVLAHCINPDPTRLKFLLYMAISAEMIDVQDGHAMLYRDGAARWLALARSAQLKALVDAWLGSVVYKELFHVPRLYPDPTGWTYDPQVSRGALLRFLDALTPYGEWWSVDEFITQVKATEPDFQRPGDDYHSWYIRDAQGEYLNGFESWDAVEGALLSFYLFGPMHWLGLVDVGTESGDDAAHLSVYGRALVHAAPWPMPTETDEAIAVTPDGTLRVSRRVSRMDRFQAMRFTTWVEAATDEDPYIYQLSLEGVKLGAEQGINTGHIGAFLARVMGVETLPPPLVRKLETWQAGPTSEVSLEPMLVLRTTAPETLDFIWGRPDLRRFCRARLGDMALAVHPDSVDALRDALAEHGIALQDLS